MGQSAGAVDICLLMASPISKDCSGAPSLKVENVKTHSTIDIRAPIRYNFVDTTGEASGERLARDFGVPSGPDTLRALGQNLQRMGS